MIRREIPFDLERSEFEWPARAEKREAFIRGFDQAANAYHEQQKALLTALRNLVLWHDNDAEFVESLADDYQTAKQAEAALFEAARAVLAKCCV